MQASSVSSFELFNVDRLQDVVKAATGAPANSDRWGRRVTGGDALGLDVNLNFAEIGALCRRIDRAHAQSDYQDNFDWIDYVQPISDPALRRQLENEVVERLRAEDPGQLELAPPQIVDWDLVSAFHYHFDRPQGEARSPVTHPDLRIVDYLRGLADRREDLAVEHLRQRPIEAVDASGNPVHKWSVWRCLVGQFSLGQRMYILDEGEFFEVRGDYLSQLDEYVSGIPRPATELPPSPAGQLEGDYNAAAASASQNLLLMDKQLVRSEGRTSPVEVCDILSTQRELIHIKRHLGSSDLSHLFSQGFVSAELIQRNPGFRSEVHALVDGLAAGRPGFSFFDDAAFASRDYTVVYGIVASWNGRRPEEALPFFSKVNLRGFVDDLRSREFNVALTTIEEVRVGSTCSQRDGPLHQ